MARSPNPAKLRWRCRRGTKELDMLTLRYLDSHYEHANVDEQCAFAALLEMQDPELYKILSREVATDDKLIHSIVEKIHSKQ